MSLPNANQVLTAKKYVNYLIFFMSIGAIYTAGVYTRIPQGIVQIGGFQIIKQTFLDAALNFTYAGLLSRLVIFVVFPAIFQVSRVLIQTAIFLKVAFGKRRVLRFISKVLGIVDSIYILVSHDPGKAALFLTFPIFGYQSTGDGKLFLGAIILPFFAFGLESFNDDVRDGKLRLNLRKRYIPRTQKGFLEASVITAAMFFIF